MVGTAAAIGPPAKPIPESPLRPADRQHWSFRPLRRPDPPAVKGIDWGRTPIDRFLLARLESKGLQPLPEADRITLIRRLSFDLIGLPPTPEEVDAFVNDTSADAYERLVDRLLARPEYGERWAQHWLDLARFAETDGFEFDAERPHAWRYRDWVIEAFNRDMPYDQFIQWQLAGDELEPNDPAASVATGFLLCGPDMPDLNLQEERRSNVLNEMTATVGSVIMGLQLGCAQCHDHKVDPISQADFYRLRAFFESAELFRDHVIATPAQRQARAEAEAEQGITHWKRELRELEDAARKALREKNPDLRPTKKDLLAALSKEDRQRHRQLTKALESKPALPELPRGRVLRTGRARPAYFLERGDFRRPRGVMAAAYPRIANLTGSQVLHTSEKPLLRAQLARWLTHPDHPLVTRVIVNRLWQHHFGRGLVDTPSDFGIMGNPPTHPELLDWLATELPRLGWSLKRLHRLMVTSAAYRQASRPGGPDDDAWRKGMERDPENLSYWRMSRRRLEGEALRDAMLAVSDRLSSRRGGPGVRPPVPAELRSTLLRGQWVESPEEEDHRRRSIYLFVRRNLRYPLFEVFDRPDTNASCPERPRSTIAPQALTLLHSEFAHTEAAHFARWIERHAADRPEARITLAWRRAFGRAPSAAELAAAGAFLRGEGSAPTENSALSDLCLALFNSSEFLYVD